MNKRTILPLLLCLLLAACKQTAQQTSLVTVTIEPLRYFAEAIAGNRFTIVTLVPNGGNPETYEPTAKQMVELSQSALYIKVGQIGFERTWMERLAESAPDTRIVDSSKGITPVQSSEHADDPHTWMSTRNAVLIAKNICNAFIQQNPEDSVYFKKNLEVLLHKIADVDGFVKTQLANSATKAFLIYHPTLTYFAHDYGLMQISVEEEGREPTAAQLKQTIVLAKQQQVKLMFVQKEFANRNTDIVAKGSGARQIEINPLSYHWDKEMRKIAQTLK